MAEQMDFLSDKETDTFLEAIYMKRVLRAPAEHADSKISGLSLEDMDKYKIKNVAVSEQLQENVQGEALHSYRDLDLYK